jgi:hypothetical protein
MDLGCGQPERVLLVIGNLAGQEALDVGQEPLRLAVMLRGPSSRSDRHAQAGVPDDQECGHREPPAHHEPGGYRGPAPGGRPARR